MRNIDPALRLQDGENVQVEYKIVDNIHCGGGDKLKSFISLVGKFDLSP
ncbi:hypothetical protein GP2143_01155 [marine gamma proteobacterium HTCC2143]|uniref:Uncharacterized protein n=1 Tax=marine gamma proteobacterium HTCC2143 TaxID=247633 RepID=A0YGG9_9GAMM|nr:hypothetical protein GP2143_01155 [marine gamma proteobacterium HTCC2143]